MNLGLCTISNRELPVERSLELAAAAGYDGVELWGDRAHVGDGSPAVLDSIVETARARSLEIAVYGSYLCAGTDAFAAEYEDELAVAERLGATLLRVWPGDRGFEDRDRSLWDAAVDDLRTLADRGAAIGVGVTVERHAGRLSNTTDGARRLIEAVDRPTCGLNWQPLFHMGSDELLAEAEILAPLSNNVHLQSPAERGGESRSPLSGAYFDVGAVLDRFDAAGFDGYVEVEFVTPELDYRTAITRDCEYLRTVLEDDAPDR